MNSKLKLDLKTREKIESLSFFFTLLVVGCHSGSWVYNGALGARCFPGFLLFCAVPWFFFVSGLLMFRSYSPSLQWWLRIMRKRVFTLLIPFFVWNIFFFLLKLIATSDINVDVIGGWYGVLTILGINILEPPPCGPFWYIRGLLLFTILSFFIGRLLSNFYIGCSLILIFFLFFIFGVEYHLLSTGIKVSSMLFFFAGAYTALHCETLIRIGKFRNMMAWLCTIMFIIVYILNVCGINISRLRPFGIICFLVSISTLLYPLFKKSTGRLNMFSRFSFFIFGIHPVMITLFNILGFNHFCGGGYYSIWVLSVISSIMLAMVVKKTFASFYLLICGGRG